MPRKKKETVFPGYIRVSEPQKEALGLLVERAIGEERSLTEFATACGVSPSTISRIINGKFATPISDKTILAIAENADPDSGVCLDDLLLVHGLAPLGIEADITSDMIQFDPDDQTEESKDKPKMKVFISYAHADSEDSLHTGNMVSDLMGRLQKARMSTSALFDLGMNSPTLKVHHDTSRVDDLVDAASQWATVKNETVVLGVRNKIQNMLVDQGYSIQLHKDYDISSLPQFRYKTNFAFVTDAVAGDGLEKWAFEVLVDDKFTAVQKLSWIFGTAYLDSPYKAGIKVSLIIFDKEEFELVKDKFADMVIQDCISVILMNKKSNEIIEEFQIAQAGVEVLPSVLMNA